MNAATVTTPHIAGEGSGSERQTPVLASGISIPTLALRLALLFFAAFALGSNAMAQHSSDAGSDEGEPAVEVFTGYSYLHEDGQNLNGWTGAVIVNVNHWFAVAADFDGHYGSHTDEFGNVRVREHGFTFGPHVAYHNHTRVIPFAFALFGGAHENVRIEGESESATGFAANLGGGLDVHVNERVSVRLIQFDAAYTRFEGQGSTSPRISTGIVFHFGKKK